MAAFSAASTSKIILCSKTNLEFQIEVDSRVIDASAILKNVFDHTDLSDAVDVDMTPKQLQNFVDFHNHFESSDAPNDPEWSNQFFSKMEESEFKDFCWKADYLDSQRFLEAGGDFILFKLENLEVIDIQKFLNIVDNYTPEERKAMEDHPLEFFTGVSVSAQDGK